MSLTPRAAALLAAILSLPSLRAEALPSRAARSPSAPVDVAAPRVSAQVASCDGRTTWLHVEATHGAELFLHAGGRTLSVPMPASGSRLVPVRGLVPGGSACLTARDRFRREALACVVVRGVSCDDDADCGEGAFCRREDGACGGPGTCEVVPEACLALWDPVCGCDGVTYGNDCEAARASVSVAHAGACDGGGPDPGPVPPSPCESSDDCAPDEYCETPPGDCAGAGACQPRPEVCFALFDPVCGCDGVTYGNDCEAAREGASVDHAGPCH